MLSTPSEINELVALLRQSPVIAFDTEFIRESTFFPIVEIIQVATEKQSWLVDARAFKKNYPASDPTQYDRGLQPLLDLFTDPSILKIVHAAQGDQECLFTSFGALASPSLDTAIAASLCGYGDGVGLAKLLKSVLDITLEKGHARTNWSVRPLPSHLLEYAHADVRYLVALGLKLSEMLDVQGRREWAFELSARWEDKTLYQSDTEALTQKLARGGRLDRRALQALRKLVQWREDRVRHLNLPRRWVADDPVLVDLARVRPKDLAHLSSFRGLNRGEFKHSGEAILTAINTADETPNESALPTSKALIPTPEETQVLDVLKCYVGILAEQHQIAAKHLLTVSRLLLLLREKTDSVEELIQKKILGPEAARLIGADLLALLNGQRMLAIRHGQVEIVKREAHLAHLSSQDPDTHQ